MPVKKDILQLELARLIEGVKHYSPGFDVSRFTKAFEFATDAHEGQMRKEDKPYIVHPLETAKILSYLHVDEDTLIAGLLHDVPEDTSHSIREIDQLFGDRVSFLVEGITKLSKVHYRHDMEERHIESLKKLLLHSAKDPRVVLIKLADRLHNMRTLQFIVKPEKRSRISRETLEIFVPIANLFGIQGIKSELEDLCFYHLYPQEYEALKERIEASQKRVELLKNNTIAHIQKELVKHQIKADIFLRRRNLYNIFKKLKAKNKNLDDIYDLIALRVVVKNTDDCYKVLGIIHVLFKPKPGKFKDYIAVPKMNGYQSLHTTVFGPQGVLTEIQIRTQQMDIEDEFGIAAHYFYAEKKKKKLQDDPRSNWVEKFLALQRQQKDNQDFLENLKYDIFQDRIFVYTPKGDVIDLPQGATAVDFAYAIHAEVGHRAFQAEVNGEFRPMTEPLKTGETVRIVLAKTNTGPNRQWLNFVKTSVARDRIREFFKKESKKNKIRVGKEILQKEFDRAGFESEDAISKKKLLGSLEKYLRRKFSNKDEVYSAIAEDTLSSLHVIKSLYPGKYLSMMGGSWLRTLIQKFRKVRGAHVGIKIYCEDRVGMFRDILNVLARFSISVRKVTSRFSLFILDAIVIITFDVPDFEIFSEVCEHLEQIPGVHKVRRFFWGRNVVFFFGMLATIGAMIAHPFIVWSLIHREFFLHHLLSDILLYGSLFLLFFMVLHLKNIMAKNFSLQETKALWITTFVASTFALLTILFEIYFFHIQLNWIIVFSGILLMYTYLLVQFLKYFHRKKGQTSV